MASIGLGVAGQDMTAAFSPSRTDGRSDRVVIYDLAEAAEPNTTFTYGDLIDALQDGLDKEVGRDRVYRAVAAANRTLLQDRKRYLRVETDVGYRVMQTSEAVAVAIDKKGRAETYLARGLEVLRNARIDELTASQRTLHEGQLLIMAGLYEATRRSERRHDRADAAIKELLQRVEQLEGGGAAERGDSQ